MGAPAGAGAPAGVGAPVGAGAPAGARGVAWALAIALLAFVCAWPVYAGLVASGDDVKFLRAPEVSQSAWADIAAAWTARGSFRPMEIVVAANSDSVSLASPPVVPLQVAGLLALAIGTVALTRRIAPGFAMAAPLMLVWLALSPATTVSLWQMDTCSQTWSAACAVWTGLLVWRGLDAARRGSMDWLAWCALVVLVLFALNIKEIFYGWSAGIGTALLVVLASMWRKDRAAAIRASVLLVPVVAMPIAHMAVRLSMGWLSAPAAVGDRYSVNLGGNLVLNAAYSLAVLFTNGPLHLLGNGEVALPLRLLSVASIFAAFCVVAAALGFWWLHRRDPVAGDAPASARRPVNVPALALAVGAAVGSLAVTIPMESVSELYGLGANVGAGLLVVCALLSLWHPAAADERLICRSVAVLGGAPLLVVGAYGVASRAYHFGVTWDHTRTINQAMLAHQKSLSGEPLEYTATIFFGKECYGGPSHSTYVVPPIMTVSPKYTEDWLNRRDPARKIAMSIDVPVDVRANADTVIDPATVRVREHW